MLHRHATPGYVENSYKYTDYMRLYMTVHYKARKAVGSLGISSTACSLTKTGSSIATSHCATRLSSINFDRFVGRRSCTAIYYHHLSSFIILSHLHFHLWLAILYHTFFGSSRKGVVVDATSKNLCTSMKWDKSAFLRIDVCILFPQHVELHPASICHYLPISS